MVAFITSCSVLVAVVFKIETVWVTIGSVGSNVELESEISISSVIGDNEELEMDSVVVICVVEDEVELIEEGESVTKVSIDESVVLASINVLEVGCKVVSWGWIWVTGVMVAIEVGKNVEFCTICIEVVEVVWTGKEVVVLVEMILASVVSWLIP